MLRSDLKIAQKAVESDPFNMEAREHELSLLKAFNEATLDEERFLKQRSKIQWLKEGDTNSAYFHKVGKGKQHRNRIQCVLGSDNVMVDGELVPGMFVKHYTNFLGNKGSV